MPGKENPVNSAVGFNNKFYKIDNDLRELYAYSRDIIEVEDYNIPEETEDKILDLVINGIANKDTTSIIRGAELLSTVNPEQANKFWVKYGDFCAETSLHYGNLNQDILSTFNNISPQIIAQSCAMAAIAMSEDDAAKDIITYMANNGVTNLYVNFEGQAETAIASYVLHEIDKDKNAEDIKHTMRKSELLRMINYEKYAWESLAAATSLMGGYIEVAEMAEKEGIATKKFWNKNSFKEETFRYFQPITRVYDTKFTSSIESVSSYFKSEEMDKMVIPKFGSYENFGKYFGFSSDTLSLEMIAKRTLEGPILDNRDIEEMSNRSKGIGDILPNDAII